jgi:quercetin dioxygenase-like cupin family protein
MSYFVAPSQRSHHEIFPGVHIYTMAAQQMMLSYVDLEPNSVVELHQHPHEQMGLLLDGELTFTVGDETKRLSPGEMWRIPGGVPHTCTAGPRGAKAIDVFCPVREDYR